MNVSKSGSLKFGWASLMVLVALLCLGLPARAGTITVVKEQYSYKPQGYNVITYLDIKGVYTLAKGEQFVSITASWQMEEIVRYYDEVTWIVTDTYYLNQLPAPGVWDVYSCVSNPLTQEWANQLQVTLNYKDATGKLKSVSTPWMWVY